MIFQVPTIYVVMFGSVPADTPCRRLMNPQTLLQPAPNEVDNVRLGGVAGRLAIDPLGDQSPIRELIWEIDGEVDSNGDPFSDRREGALSNFDDLVTDIYRQSPVNGGVPVDVNTFTGVREGLVQFLSCTAGEGLEDFEVRMECLLPAGELTPVGS